MLFLELSKCAYIRIYIFCYLCYIVGLEHLDSLCKMLEELAVLREEHIPRPTRGLEESVSRVTRINYFLTTKMYFKIQARTLN